MDSAIVNWCAYQVSVYQMEKRLYFSGVFALITVVVWIWTKNLVSHGVDGTVMLFAWMSTILTGGSLIVGAISLLIKKIKHKEK